VSDSGLLEGTQHRAPLDERTTVVVVGTGAGGAVVAKELAEAGVDVIMVEEGGWHPPSSYVNKTPLQVFRDLYRDYGMTTALGQNPLRDPAVPFPLGKCVGGTTVVNSGTCFRTPASVLASWQTAFGLEIEPEELAPHFDSVEQHLGIGPVPDDVLGANARTFARGAEALGWEGRPLNRNAPGCRGAGRCVFGCPSNAKQGTHLNYVPRALAAGARLITDFRVERLRRDGRKIIGVEGTLLDRTRNRPTYRATVIADYVVVAAGAVGSPTLLQRRRVAAGKQHLGRHLRLRPGIRVAALFDERIEGWKGVPQGYYVDRFWQDYGVMYEGIFVPPGVALPVLPGSGPEFLALARRYPNLAAFGAMVKDTSSGTVKARGKQNALIRYRLNRVDTEHLAFAVKKAAEAYFAAGAKTVFPAIFGFPELDHPDQLARLDPARVKPQHLELMAFHPMGTVRMASDSRQGVLDGYGAVFGEPNVYVADASIFPNCLGVNPMESIMAFARRTAHRIADCLG